MLKAVLLEIPEVLLDWLAERSRLGLDRLDEMWDGVLHMVPAPDYGHQRRGTRLARLLDELADETDLGVTYETNVLRPGAAERDYRVPDLVVAHPNYVVQHGVDGRAELVVEIRSPYDESWEKLPFFAEMGIPEVLILEPFEPVLLRLAPDGTRYDRVAPDPDGWVVLQVLPLSLRAAIDGIEAQTAHRTLMI
jgi:Uma2 family endonuclease